MFLLDASTKLRLAVQGGVLVLAVVVDALMAQSATNSGR
jgi:ABC-type xylose transport system permease subunit